MIVGKENNIKKYAFKIGLIRHKQVINTVIIIIKMYHTFLKQIKLICESKQNLFGKTKSFKNLLFFVKIHW